jgi:thiosulfate dehydrogenase [quinone] large subunit
MSKKSDSSVTVPLPQSNLGQVFATLLLRLWLGVRALQTGIEKYAGSKMSTEAVKVDGQVYDVDLTDAVSVKHYALENYSGVPESLKGAFAKEPLMMDWALKLFDTLLGPALIVLGITILLGLASRVSLFLLGVLYVGLTWGLILIKQDAGVAWLGVHMVMIVLALAWSDHNRLTLLKRW